MNFVDIIPGLLFMGAVFAVLYFTRKSGKDAVEKQVAQDVLKDINNALRPIPDDELERVRKKYRRD